MTPWTKAEALQAIEDFDDYARMGVPGGVEAVGAYMVLTEYVEQQEAKYKTAIATIKKLEQAVDGYSVPNVVYDYKEKE